MDISVKTQQHMEAADVKIQLNNLLICLSSKMIKNIHLLPLQFSIAR